VCEEKETGPASTHSAQLSSPLESYNDRIRLLDKMCSLYVEEGGKKEEDGANFEG